MWVPHWLHKLFHCILAHVLGQSFPILVLFLYLHSSGPGLGLLEYFLKRFLGQLLCDVGSLSDNALARCIRSIGCWPVNDLAHSLRKLGALVENGWVGCSVDSSGYPP